MREPEAKHQEDRGGELARSHAGGPAQRRPIVPQRLYRQVADALEERVRVGEFADGKLPTERSLAAFYGVSRTCVREALLALEIAGLVSIRVGSGVYIVPQRPVEPPPTEIAPEARSPSEIIEARLMFEPVIAAAAANRRRTADLAALSAAIALMRREHRQAAETEVGDREFHIALARASGNPIAEELVRSLLRETQGAFWQGLQRHIRSPVLRLQWIRDHEEILAALELSDRRRSRAAVRRHLENVRRSLELFDVS